MAADLATLRLLGLNVVGPASNANFLLKQRPQPHLQTRCQQTTDDRVPCGTCPSPTPSTGQSPTTSEPTVMLGKNPAQRDALADAALHLESSKCPDGMQDFLKSRVTALVFTSPVSCQPSLEMILAVIESFKFLPGLAECRLLVTCDGPGRISSELRPKRGFVTAEVAERYKQYVLRLQSALGDDCVLALPEREGFGRAVRSAIDRVTTPYALLCQHDNIFIRPVDLCAVVRIMECNAHVLKCVHFTSPKTTFDGEGGDDACLRRVEDRLGRVAGGSRTFSATQLGTTNSKELCSTFWPMPSWLERNHICETAHYRDFVLGPDTRIKSGQFIEETFGQKMRLDLASGGDHDKYGVYRLIDIPESATLHLDGRTYLPAIELRRRGWRESTLFARLARQHTLWLRTGEWVSSAGIRAEDISDTAEENDRKIPT